MPTPLRRRIRHARRLIGYGALVALILLATVVGALNQLLPLLERHPERVARWLETRTGQPVGFDRVTGEWTGRGPRLRFEGLRIGAAESALHVGRAELLVAVYSGLFPGEPLTELKIHDLALSLEQGEDRRWRLTGLPFEPQPGADPLATLESLGELQVERARLTIRSPLLTGPRELARVDLRLRVSGERLRAGVRVWAAPGGEPLTAVADLRRGDWSGQLWAGADELPLHPWSPLLRRTGVAVAGTADLDLWATIEAQRVVDVRVRADLRPLALAANRPWLPAADGVTGPDGEPVLESAPPVAWERARLLGRWQVDGDGWQLQVPELTIDETGAGDERRFDGLWIGTGDGFAVTAPRLDLGPAGALASLGEAVPPGLRQWLHRAAPDGELRDVAVRGRDGAWAGHARLVAAGWSPHAGGPGLDGLSGELLFDQDGGSLALAGTGGPGWFRWSRFRQPLPLRLEGVLAWWRSDDHWHAGAAGLRVRGVDFGADLRLELDFAPAAGRPRLDLAARVEETPVPAAGHFWVVGGMPERTIQWLDRGLLGGTVSGGRAVIGGDLDQWPFRDGSGRFDARARVVGALVDFHPDWPAVEGLDVEVIFDGPGMVFADGAGTLRGNRVARFDGAIADFRDPILALDIATPVAGEPLRGLLQASPLGARWGEHLENARLEGPATLDLRLQLPLAARLGDDRIDGVLRLDGARLGDPRWGIDFTAVTGSTRFSEKGFAAEALAVEVDGAPAVFDLRVGADYTGDPALAAVAVLRGTLPAATLLRRHEPLDWLQPWLDGAAEWNLRVDVPQAPEGGPAPPSRLQLGSDLVGIAVGLPAPLAKPAETPLRLRLEAPLPLESGELRLQLGDGLLSLRARNGADGTLRGLLRFGGDADLVPDGDGLVVDGHVEVIDAAGWVAFAAAPGQAPAPAGDTPVPATEGAASALRSVDLRADRLELVGAPFADARLRLQRLPAGTRVDVEAAAIAGRVDIPQPVDAGVRARFERLHWPPSPEPDPARRADADAGESDDPRRVPPLDIVIEDLRRGDLVLGRTELQATPHAGGLRIDRFSSASPSLELTASGEWEYTRPGRSLSRFELEVGAGRLGELLEAFGLAGMVEGGRARARIAGRWPGSPGNFSLARFEGQLAVEVGEGALLEIEPGGGRVLGLLSLAEIPRRLTLDFSDFFDKGFGFNTMAGEFAFADGRATTDLLRIDGPAAEIRISGATDLEAREYDQRIEVLPKAGGVLPAIGAIAGGPVGAAVGAVAQAVLNKPLKEAARTVYRVTGPWEEPVVEVIERGERPQGQ